MLDHNSSFDETIERAWLDEARRRLQEIEDGTVTPIPASEVIDRIREQLADQSQT